MQLALICIQQQLTDAQMADKRDAPAMFGRKKDWQPFCLRQCPSGWKQLHCITVTTAAVWEWSSMVHTAVAHWQAAFKAEYIQFIQIHAQSPIMYRHRMALHAISVGRCLTINQALKSTILT